MLDADIKLLAHLSTGEDHHLKLNMNADGQITAKEFQYGGPPQAAPQRASNLALDFLRTLQQL